MDKIKHKQKTAYLLFYMGLMCLLAVFTLYSLTASAGTGDASITIAGGEQSANLTTVTGFETIDFGSFRPGSSVSSIAIDNNISTPVHVTTGDVDIEEVPSRPARFTGTVAANSQVTINVGNGILTTSDTRVANNARAIGQMQFNTNYNAYVTTDTCTQHSCLPSSTKTIDATGEQTIQSGAGTTLFVDVAATLAIPANADTQLKYGVYTGTYTVTATYE